MRFMVFDIVSAAQASASFAASTSQPAAALATTTPKSAAALAATTQVGSSFCQLRNPPPPRLVLLDN